MRENAHGTHKTQTRSNAKPTQTPKLAVQCGSLIHSISPLSFFVHKP